MSAATSVAIAATFVWLGMVLAISFLEAPLKFRASGVTLPIGVGIGRLVFRALNASEALLAAVWLVAAIAGPVRAPAVMAGALPIAVLVLQVAVVRPRLSGHSDAVIAGSRIRRSSSHYAYVATEIVKVAALATAGLLLLAGGN